MRKSAERMDAALSYYTRSRKRPRVDRRRGAIFVQHKHLEDELFDKGYYYILATKARGSWGNPTATTRRSMLGHRPSPRFDLGATEVVVASGRSGRDE